MRLADGRIVVADAGARSFHLFSASGAFQRSVGRRGDGPGEFQAVSHMTSYRADSILVFDLRLRRVTVVSSDVQVGRTAPLSPPSPGLTARLIAGAPDGRWLVVASAAIPPAPTPRLMRHPEELWWYSSSGAPESRIGRFPGAEFYAEPGMIVGPALFGRRSHYALQEDTVVVGTMDRFAIQRMHSERAAAPLTWPVPPRLASQEMVVAERARLAEEVEQAYGRDPTPWAESRKAWAIRASSPDTLPAWDRLLVDDVGGIWLRHFQAPGERQDSVRWAWGNGDAVVVQALATPPGVEVLGIGHDWLLGLREDDDGVATVVVYALIRFR